MTKAGISKAVAGDLSRRLKVLEQSSSNYPERKLKREIFFFIKIKN